MQIVESGFIGHKCRLELWCLKIDLQSINKGMKKAARFFTEHRKYLVLKCSSWEVSAFAKVSIITITGIWFWSANHGKCLLLKCTSVYHNNCRYLVLKCKKAYQGKHTPNFAKIMLLSNIMRGYLLGILESFTTYKMHIQDSIAIW